jgi:hypothetical protein
LVLAGDRQAATVEAGIAAAVLTLILPLMVWTYQTTRPMVQVATLRAIDAAIPTIGSAALTEPATIGTRRSPAPTPRRPATGDETLRASTGDVTLAAPRPAGDATIVSPHRMDDETVVSPHVDDKTVVTPPRADDPPAQAR